MGKSIYHMMHPTVGFQLQAWRLTSGYQLNINPVTHLHVYCQRKNLIYTIKLWVRATIWRKHSNNWLSNGPSVHVKACGRARRVIPHMWHNSYARKRDAQLGLYWSKGTFTLFDWINCFSGHFIPCVPYAKRNNKHLIKGYVYHLV